MSSKSSGKSKSKKPLHTTLGKAPPTNDLSHLRKPIDTSIFGLEQVLELVKTASDEVKRYIKYECDVMYECRVCRTIFRSLANFVLHKRKFCLENYNPMNNFRCLENNINIIRDGNEIDENEDTSETEETNKNLEIAATTNSKKLTNIVEKLLERQKGFNITQETVNEDLSTNTAAQELDSGQKVMDTIATETIESTDAAVFQTMFKNMMNEHKTTELMKSQVMEIHDILDNDEVIIGEDGKVLERIMIKNCNRVTKPQEKLMCSICNLKFSTKKTLMYHVRYKHNDSRIVYPCPVCNDTFANAWGVFRHLCKVHRKTNAQIKKMRAQIHASGIRKDELPKKKDESKDTSEKCEENQWMDNIEGDKDFQMCGGCGKRFERKAALHSHSQICMKRIAVCNSIKENNKKTSAEESAKKYPPRLSKRKPCFIKKKSRVLIPDIEMRSDKSENGSETHSNQNDDVILIEDDEFEMVSGREEIEKVCANTTIVNETKLIEENDFPIIKSNQNEQDLISQDIVINDSSSIDLNHENMTDEHNTDRTLTKNRNVHNFTELNLELKDVVQKICEVNTNDSRNKTSRGSVKRKNSSLLCDENEFVRTITEEMNKKLLEEKMLNYVDKNSLKCLPCNLFFISYKYLFIHMAKHFNWFRYQCIECSLMFSDKELILKHIKHSHEDLQNFPESYIFNIPKWQTCGMITEFTKIDSVETLGVKTDLDKKTCNSEEMQMNHKTDLEESSLDCYDLEECLKSNNQKDLQKIVRQVILGENTDTSEPAKTQRIDAQPKKLPEYNRPARNRVKSINNDFVYDMLGGSKTTRVQRDSHPTEKFMQFNKNKPVKTYTKRDLTKNRNNNDEKKIIIICDDDSK